MFGRGIGILQLTAPGLELRFIQTEFAGSGGYANALCKLESFVTELRCVLFTGLFTG